MRLKTLAIVICSVFILTGCARMSTPTQTQAAETAAPYATASAEPTEIGGAPEATFTAVGNTATFDNGKGISGKAVVAGLQTLIILSFSYDGKAQADLRLIKADDPAHAVLILTKLERAFNKETLQFTIPNELTPGSADSIAVYDTASNSVLASATFQ